MMFTRMLFAPEAYGHLEKITFTEHINFKNSETFFLNSGSFTSSLVHLKEFIATKNRSL